MTSLVWPKELVGRLTEIAPVGPAVYFLVDDREVLYIGASRVPDRRAAFHRGCRKKSFANVFFLACPEADLEAVEKKWISVFKPKHNKMGNPEKDEAADSWSSITNGARMASFRLSDETMADLEQARVRYGLRSVTAAIRFLARAAKRKGS